MIPFCVSDKENRVSKNRGIECEPLLIKRVLKLGSLLLYSVQNEKELCLAGEEDRELDICIKWIHVVNEMYKREGVL